MEILECLVKLDGTTKESRREETEEEIIERERNNFNKLKVQRIQKINERLKKLTEDFAQVFAGAVYEDIEARKLEFKNLHLELLELLGKPPKQYSSTLDSSLNSAND